ncbi:MAG: ribosome silencing factor [Bacteroidota bacterium]|jgi:ribosome-associated protein
MKPSTVVTAKQLADAVVQGLQDKKGLSIVVMDLRKVRGAISDYFVICSGTSDKHVQALGDTVWEEVRVKWNDKPINIEGRSKGEWILMDYVNVVVHIFLEDKRRFYDIEGLWGDAVTVKVPQAW